MNAPATNDHAASAEPSTFRKLFERVFPKMGDFFGALANQCNHVATTTGYLVEFMETGDQAIGERIRADEHEADTIKAHNLHELNEAFSTPIDREDLHRAIINLDEIINSCNSIIVEMDGEMLALRPDKHCLEMSVYLKDGVEAIAAGYSRLGSDPKMGRSDAERADKAQRSLTRTHRRALAELFQDNDFHNIFRRKEIYSLLIGAGDRLNICNSTLLDIVVKLC